MVHGTDLAGADAAVDTLTRPDGSPLDGSGVSVGVIDSGVDPAHPSFRNADGSSAVVGNNTVLCDPFALACTVQDVGPLDKGTGLVDVPAAVAALS